MYGIWTKFFVLYSLNISKLEFVLCQVNENLLVK